MIEILLISAVLGVVVFLLVVFLSLKIIRRIARQEVREKIRPMVMILVGCAIGGAMAWQPFMRYQSDSAAEKLLEDYCRGAREEIYRTVDDVRGLYIRQPPLSASRGSHFHEEEGDGLIGHRDRPYRFVELGTFGKNPRLRFQASHDGTWKEVGHSTPISRYGLTWNSLTTIPDRNLGVNGDETVIYDLETGEILARRVFYYREDQSVRDYMVNAITTCPDIDLGTESRHLDKRVRDSYGFVSRVLIPPPPDDTPGRPQDPERPDLPSVSSAEKQTEQEVIPLSSEPPPDKYDRMVEDALRRGTSSGREQPVPRE